VTTPSEAIAREIEEWRKLLAELRSERDWPKLTLIRGGRDG